jgi:hypothetical protein
VGILREIEIIESDEGSIPVDKRHLRRRAPDDPLPLGAGRRGARSVLGVTGSPLCTQPMGTLGVTTIWG